MTEDNKIVNSVIPIGSTDLVRVGNSIDITNKIIKEHEERGVSENFKSVKIGNQYWMTKNLDVDCYLNGDSILQVQTTKDLENIKMGAWCYDTIDRGNNSDCANDENNSIGKIYNWYAINDIRGLAPKGFNIPNSKDWKILFEYTYQMLILENPNITSLKEGFQIIVDDLFLLIRDLIHIVGSQPSHYFFWTSTEMNSEEAVYVNFCREWSPEFFLHSSNTSYGRCSKKSGYYVRCIKNI